MLTKALLCLALSVFHEGRNQSLEGQKAIAHVIMNRTKSDLFRSDVCKVVTQPGQFSWVGHVSAVNTKNAIEKEAWEDAKRIAFSVLSRKEVDNTNGAVFYHRKGSKPHWARSKDFRRVAFIDDHIFYKKISQR